MELCVCYPRVVDLCGFEYYIFACILVLHLPCLVFFVPYCFSFP